MEADIGAGYDVVLIPNLIHYLDRAASVEIFKKVRAAMNPGALLAIAEFAPNDDRVSTPHLASYAIFCLAISPGGGCVHGFRNFCHVYRSGIRESHGVESQQGATAGGRQSRTRAGVGCVQADVFVSQSQ